MTDSSELQGEIAALRCFVVALASTLPLACQLRLWPSFEALSDLAKFQLSNEALAGFERMAVSLSARRPTSETGRDAAPRL